MFSQIADEKCVCGCADQTFPVFWTTSLKGNSQNIVLALPPVSRLNFFENSGQTASNVPFRCFDSLPMQ